MRANGLGKARRAVCAEESASTARLRYEFTEKRQVRTNHAAAERPRGQKRATRRDLSVRQQHGVARGGEVGELLIRCPSIDQDDVRQSGRRFAQGPQIVSRRGGPAMSHWTSP